MKEKKYKSAYDNPKHWAYGLTDKDNEKQVSFLFLAFFSILAIALICDLIYITIKNV